LASPRFAAYRQRILDRLLQLGYVADWRILQAADFGMAQLRPRFVLVALKADDAPYFSWPTPQLNRVTVGEALRDLMAANGWPHVDEWVSLANGIGPTLVGGSKKHGGADLGPTRAKQAWAALGVNGKGVADEAPGPDAPAPSEQLPKLTIQMVARLQGWAESDLWEFTGRKTSQYRQIGNAFPPPMAEAVGLSIKRALLHEGEARANLDLRHEMHDPIYKALAVHGEFVGEAELMAVMGLASRAGLNRHLDVIAKDFDLDVRQVGDAIEYRLVGFKGFTGQEHHARNEYMLRFANRIS
jgi:DNA (cytosine-5)-methyltransferase 1